MAERWLKDCWCPKKTSVLLDNDDDSTAATHPLSPPSALIDESFDIAADNNENRWRYYSNNADFDSLQEEREQALRDYKVTIEYKHLKSHAPGGVYLVPSLDDLRKFYGIIFVRRGPFTNGIFKFQLRLPPTYNDVNQHPRITFESYIYNPHVNAETGELDITTAYPRWDPSKHYLVTVLTFLKKIFYAKTFDDAMANPEARELAKNDASTYRKNVDACVRESQKQVFVNMDDESTARFTEEELSHRVLRDLLKGNVRDPAHVSRQSVLSMIDKASKV
jgi:ubiquitin-protein ligase